MESSAFDVFEFSYFGLALFIQSLMNDRRSVPVSFFLSARLLQTFILSF
jgi:hypothetical protein